MVKLKTHSVLLIIGGVCLLCGLLGILIRPEVPPTFESLQVSPVRLSMARPGRQHCGRAGLPLMGHAGGWVLGVVFDGREQCFIVYTPTPEQNQRLAALPPLAEVTARHTGGIIWQLENEQGVLVSYEAALADTESAWISRRWAQATYWGLGLVLVSAGISLRRKRQAPRPLAA